MIHANDTLSCRHSVKYAKQTSQQFTIHQKAIFFLSAAVREQKYVKRMQDTKVKFGTSYINA